jgi:hypothetical protein
LSEYTLEEVGVYDWPVGEKLAYSGEPNQYVRDLPHYSRVPKDAIEQLKWRQDLLDACKGSKKNQDRVLGMCREDLLWWINSFCMLYEPRNPKRTTIPFNSWPHQDDVIAAIDHYLGIREFVVNKSRGEGCSWLVLMIFLHRWLFATKDNFGSFGLVSLNQALVDDSKNPASLMWKLDWQIKHLPPWMIPKGFNWNKHRSRSEHVLLNPVCDATITGYACTQNVATGDRKTAFLMDELGKWPRPQDSVAMTSTQAVTNCRIVVSTPFGNEGAYFDAVHGEHTGLICTMHWSFNPTRKRGMYKWDTEKDKLVKLDLNFNYKDDYRFIKDGKTRSPWYDAESRKQNATVKSMAQDYDLNFEQSVSLFFEPAAMKLARESIRGPIHVGRFTCDQYGGEAVFCDDSLGNVRLWNKLNNGKLPPSKYVIGVDIAQGTGTDFSSNSVIQVVNMVTGDQVLEWVDNATRPDDCAVIAVSIAKWLQGGGGSPPFLIWECGGPGGDFGRQVDLMGWTNYYNRPDHKKFKRNKISENRSGFRGSKADALSPLQVAIKLRKVTLFSQELVDELTEYRFIPGGKVEHFKAVVSEDESSKGQNHGDRAMAMAMAIVGMNEFRNPRQPQKPPDSVWRGPNRIELLLRELQSEENGYEACFS